MSPADIVAEHGLSRPLLQHHIDALRSEGVPPEALLRSMSGDWSLILRDRVTFTVEHGFEFARYRPDWSAVGAYVLIGLDEFGEAADLVAWRPPHSIASWLGRVGLLGEELVHGPRFEPLRVHGSVLDWLRAGRNGMAIVDPTRAAPVLRDTGPLQVGTVEHRRRLVALLTRPAPRIEVCTPTLDNVQDRMNIVDIINEVPNLVQCTRIQKVKSNLVENVNEVAQ